MAWEKLTFTGAFGDDVAARLDGPDETSPNACVLFARCFSGFKSRRTALRITKALWLGVFALFRSDFTGLGASEGGGTNPTFSTNVGNLAAA